MDLADGGLSSARTAHSGSHMLNIRNARIRSENDVTLLRNRLERLAQEERKALKKIEETKRRAEQIIQLKARNERNHLRKQLEAEYAERQRERARDRLQQSKIEMSGSMQANLQAIQNQKKQGADHLREQRQLINEHLRQRQEQQLDRNRKVTELIRERAAEVQRLKMQQRMEHEEALQQEMEEKMMIEEQKRNLAEKIVAELEDQEEIAIDRLRRTQEAQKAAYEELERALVNPPPPVDQREAALGHLVSSSTSGI